MLNLLEFCNDVTGNLPITMPVLPGLYFIKHCEGEYAIKVDEKELGILFKDERHFAWTWDDVRSPCFHLNEMQIICEVLTFINAAIDRKNAFDDLNNIADSKHHV